MKKIVNHMGKNYDKTRVLGIDPSSTAIAFTLIEGGRPLVGGKITFFRKSTQYSKFRMIPTLCDVMLDATKPSMICVEQMISVQNPTTTRVLSYIVGGLEYELAQRGFEVLEVPPMTHKNYHGYIKVTKKLIEINKWSKKEADRFRKSQIQDKISKHWGWFPYRDSDIADSCSIALWGAEVSLK